MSFKFTGDIRKEDLVLSCRPTYSCRFVVVEPGKQVHHCKPKVCDDLISPYVAKTDLNSVMCIWDLLLENGELQRQEDCLTCQLAGEQWAFFWYQAK